MDGRRAHGSELWALGHEWHIYEVQVTSYCSRSFWGHSVNVGLLLKMCRDRPKRGEIWNSGILVFTIICGTFDLVWEYIHNGLTSIS